MKKTTKSPRGFCWSESVKLFFLAIWVQIFEFSQCLWLLIAIYPFYSFANIDRLLFFHYWRYSAYQIARDFAFARNDDPYTYGETPLSTLLALLKKVKLEEQELFVECGCGRGRSCFFVRQVIGCRVEGLDYNPVFIEKAQDIVQKQQLEKIDFYVKDFTEYNFSKASLVYLYGSHLDDRSIKAFVQRVKKTGKKGLRLLTVSYSLDNWDNSFYVEEVYVCRFVWGSTEVYLQTIT